MRSSEMPMYMTIRLENRNGEAIHQERLYVISAEREHAGPEMFMEAGVPGISLGRTFTMSGRSDVTWTIKGVPIEAPVVRMPFAKTDRFTLAALLPVSEGEPADEAEDYEEDYRDAGDW